MDLESIFHAAIERPPQERAKYLEEACGSDKALRLEVEALIAADDGAATFMAGLESQIQSVLKHHQETGTEIGRYRIDRKVASGGMGSVYQAWDSKLNRDVALKFLHPHCALDPSAKQRFVREAHAVSKLNHPNICTVHDVAESDSGEQYIVMELCIGQRLDELINENKLSFASIFDIADQLAAALGAAHTKDILHRDLKPQNVIIGASNFVKLLDFGIAKIVGTESSATSQALGTVTYMSPEQFKAGKQDQRADVWALGTLLFEMLTGVTPFTGKTQPEVMRAIFDRRRLSLKDLGCGLPDEFELFFDSCLAHSPQDRIPTMAAFSSKLAELRVSLSSADAINETPQYANAASDSRNTQHSSQNERRNVTILHYRAMNQANMDPEDSAGALDQIGGVFQKIIRRFGAYQFSNNRSELAAYFGYPKADEHSTIQAVRCALALKEATLRRQGLNNIDGWSAQIAVHTDLMITRSTDTSDGIELIGDGPAVAQNLSFNAAPDQILVSSTTAELVKGFFSTNDIETNYGPVSEVLRESTAKSKFDVALAAGLTPLRGRVHELGMLIEAWHQAIENDGRVIAISGDAGIGKSRLLHELKERAADSADAWLVECQCSPYESNSALYPVIRYFTHDLLQFNDALSEEEKASRVVGFLTEYDFTEEDIAILAEVFGAPIHLETNALISPEQRQTIIFASLAKLLKQRATFQPVLVIFEDLHWADASTNKLIELLLQQNLPPNLLLLLTFRPSYKPRWLTTENVTRLVVQRLSKKDSVSLIETTYGTGSINFGILERLMEKTDGNPLFIETLTRAVANRGVASIDSIPNSLQDSLSARLDQIGPAKLVAQHAAVIGREFSVQLLQECLPHDFPALENSLQQLADAQLISAPALEQTNYRFKHALIRDAAYDSLLKTDRARIHGSIAHALADKPNTSAALLANHYDLAGSYEDAARMWLRAAKSALNQAAAREAFGLCERGLEAVDKASMSDTLTKVKIDLLLTLGPAVIATRGYADHRIEESYSQALTLSQDLGADDLSFAALFGAYTFNVVSAKHEKSLGLAAQLIEIADREADAELLVEANMASGISRFFIGDFLTAHDSFSRTIELYSPEAHGRHAVTYGQDPKMIALAHLGWIELILGNSGLALTNSANAIAHARALKHPFSITYALVYDGATQLYAGNIDAGRRSLDEALQSSGEQNIRGVEVLARVFLAMVDVFDAPSKESVTKAEMVIESYKNSSAKLFLTAWSVELGLAYLALDDVAKAAEKLDLAGQQMQEFGERWYEFPILRSRAILAERQNNLALAAEYREQASNLLNKTRCRGWLSQVRFGNNDIVLANREK